MTGNSIRLCTFQISDWKAGMCYGWTGGGGYLFHLSSFAIFILFCKGSEILLKHKLKRLHEFPRSRAPGPHDSVTSYICSCRIRNPTASMCSGELCGRVSQLPLEHALVVIFHHPQRHLSSKCMNMEVMRTWTGAGI